jgi:hypothetical protein
MRSVGIGLHMVYYNRSVVDFGADRESIRYESLGYMIHCIDIVLL